MQEQTKNSPGMNDFDVTGEVIIEETLEAPNAREAVLRFMTLNPEAMPTHVGSRAFVGLCVNTGAVVLEGDVFERIEPVGDLIVDDWPVILRQAVDGEGEDDHIFVDVDDIHPAILSAPLLIVKESEAVVDTALLLQIIGDLPEADRQVWAGDFDGELAKLTARLVADYNAKARVATPAPPPTQAATEAGTTGTAVTAEQATQAVTQSGVAYHPTFDDPNAVPAVPDPPAPTAGEKDTARHDTIEDSDPGSEQTVSGPGQNSAV